MNHNHTDMMYLFFIVTFFLFSGFSPSHRFANGFVPCSHVAPFAARDPRHQKDGLCSNDDHHHANIPRSSRAVVMTSTTAPEGQEGNIFNAEYPFFFDDSHSPSSSSAYFSNDNQRKVLPPVRAVLVDESVLPDKEYQEILPSTVMLPVPSSPTTGASTTIGINVLWKRMVLRLNTHEDPFKLHKVSGFVWIASGLFMLGTGATNGFTEVPGNLCVPTWLYLISAGMQTVTSFRMSLLYRANDPHVQRGFINSSIVLSSTAYTCLYLSPFAPEFLNIFWIGNALVVLFNLPGVYFGFDESWNLLEKIDHRRMRNKEQSLETGMVGDLLSYGIVVWFGFFGSLAGVIFASMPQHDRFWLMEQSSQALWSSSHFVPESYYGAAGTGLAAGIGALGITLRDKKLISKGLEQVLVSIFTIPSTLLFLHSFRIIYWWGE